VDFDVAKKVQKMDQTLELNKSIASFLLVHKLLEYSAIIMKNNYKLEKPMHLVPYLKASQ
jgi:hypothetical protein